MLKKLRVLNLIFSSVVNLRIPSLNHLCGTSLASSRGEIEIAVGNPVGGGGSHT